MKKPIAAFTVAFLAGVALAVPGSMIVSDETQAATRTAPTTSSFSMSTTSTIGNALPLRGVDAFRVSICSTAPTNTVLGGTGNLRAYLLDERSAVVQRNPALDLAVSGTTACQVFPDQVVGVQYDDVMYVTDAVVSQDGGTLLSDAGTGIWSVKMRGFKANQ